MQVDFYFDPACPWSWVTSRWVCEVAEQRQVSVQWRPYSLFLGGRPDGHHLERRLELAASARALRLIEAVRERYGDEAIAELYTRLGMGFHHNDHRAFEHAGDAIAEMGLDGSLTGALEDPRWDAAIWASMAEAHEVADDDADTPLLVLQADGPKRAFHGPIFSPAPTGLAALSAWDGFVALIATPGFFELTRHRDRGPLLPARPTITASDVIDLTRHRV